ncbi:MAG TPA: hypothetical protein VI300_31695 [Solirubrobacter sp.]
MRRFEPVAGLGGLALIVSLFLPWYAGVVPVPEPVREPPSYENGIIGLLNTYTGLAEVTGWQAFTVTDWVLAAVALPAVAVPVVSLLASGPAKPIAAAVLAGALGWIAVLLVAFRLLDPPGGNLDLRYGAWLALAGAVLAWVGSWLSLRDESTPGAVAPDVPARPIPG